MATTDPRYKNPAELLNAAAREVVHPDRFFLLSERYGIAENILDAIPDGWAKVDGEWVRIEAIGRRRDRQFSTFRGGVYVGEEPVYGRTD